MNFDDSLGVTWGLFITEFVGKSPSFIIDTFVVLFFFFWSMQQLNDDSNCCNFSESVLQIALSLPGLAKFLMQLQSSLFPFEESIEIIHFVVCVHHYFWNSQLHSIKSKKIRRKIRNTVREVKPFRLTSVSLFNWLAYSIKNYSFKIIHAYAVNKLLKWLT